MGMPNDQDNQRADYIAESCQTLDEIANLKYNWNNNHADPFPELLIVKCKFIVHGLKYQPAIFPTALKEGCIQFEWKKMNGDYLEFEIYEDKLNCYWESDNQKYYQHETTVKDTMLVIETINFMVDNFYGSEGE